MNVFTQFHHQARQWLLCLFFLSASSIAALAQVQLSADNVTGLIGSQQVVLVSASNFNCLIAGQGTISYDDTKLTLVGVEQFNPSLGLATANFGTATAGKITFSWDDATLNGVTLPSNATLFGIRFTLTGAAGSVVPVTFVNAPTPIEFIKCVTFAAQSTTITNGSVTIVANAIITNALANSTYCQGDSIFIPFTASGVYSGGNTFTAQLSDASGSFAAPTILASRTVSPIRALVPNLSGTGFRVRVVSTNPAVTGTNNGTNITINARPTVVATAVSPTICEGASTTINATGAATYTWSPAAGLSATTGTTVTANPTTTTTYTVIGTSALGCFNTTTVTVTVNPRPTVGATATTPVICTGSSTTITATGASTYTWSPATGLSATTGTTVTANPTATTTYTVTGTGANGCTNTSTVTITVNPLPTVGATASTPTICNGSSTSITATGAASYTWSPAIGLSATTGAIVTANPTTNTTYTVTGTNANGCINTTTVTITVNPRPTVGATATTPTICLGGSTPLTATGGVSYVWSPSTGLSATTGSTVTANPTTTTTYTVTGTGANGCTNTATVTVTVNALPTVGATALTPTICNGSSTTITATGAANYTWSPSTGLSATTGTTVTANPTTNTTYTVTGTAATGCVSTTTVTITVNPRPTIGATATTPTICNGGSTPLTANGGVTYTWSPSTGLSATTGTIVTASPTATTTYTVTGTGANGCTNTSTVLVTVNPLPTVVATATTPSICFGGSTPITATGATSYSWSPATGLSATTGTTVTANPTTTTTYTVTGTGANGCINTTTVTITVNPLPTVGATAATPTICNGSSTTLTATGAATYTWSPATGLSATTGATVTANPTATRTYTVTGTTAAGCVNTTTVTITVNTLPTVSATATKLTLCAGDSSFLTANGALSYTWSPATGLNLTTGVLVKATPAVTTTYTVTGTGSNGCSNTSTVTVTVNTKPTVTAIATTPTICSGSSTPIIAGGAATYVWSPSIGLSATTGATVIANPTTTTTYTVIGTGSNGCNSTTTVTVTVNPLSVISLSATSTSICAGTPTTITATGSVTYTWSPTSGLSATTGDNVVATPASTTTYTVTGVDANGCSSTSNITISVTPITNVSFKGDSVFADPGAQRVVTIRATGWTNILATQFTVSWDPAVATYVGVEAFGIPEISSADFGVTQVAAGKLIFAWIDGSFTPRSLPNGNVLFGIRFNAIGAAGTKTAVDINSSISAIEVTNDNLCILNTTVKPGQLSVSKLFAVSGTVIGENTLSKPVRSVTLNSTGGFPAVQTVTTPVAGSFSFNIYQGSNLSIKGLKQNDVTVNNGVTTLDIALIRRQILGITNLSTAYRQIAADANKDGAVSTADIPVIRQVVLAITNYFPGSRQWVFVNPRKPLVNPPFPFYSDADTTITLNNVQADSTAKNIVGIKIGDVNSTWDNTIAREAVVGQVDVIPGQVQALTQTRVKLPLRAYHFDGVAGFQFTLDWDPTLVQFASLTQPLRGLAFSAHRAANGKLTVSWDDPSGAGQTLADGSIIGYAEFNVVGAVGNTAAIRINNSLIRTEAFNANLEGLALNNAAGEIKIVTTITSLDPNKTNGLALLPNVPNPFSHETKLRFTLAESQNVELTITNLLGQVVYQHSGAYAAGLNEQIWDATNVAAGTYVAVLKAGDERMVQRLVRE